MLLAIDPGPEQSAWLAFGHGNPTAFGICENHLLLSLIEESTAHTLAVESVASYGMSVGADVFETCVWVGRFIQHWVICAPGSDSDEQSVYRVYRRDVKLYLCGSARAKDANVRQALIDRYGPGKDAAIGKKANPGPLYGVTSHVWSALAVAVTAVDAMVGEREAA